MKKLIIIAALCLAGTTFAYKFPPSFEAMQDSIGSPVKWAPFGQTAVDSMTDKPTMEKQKL
ncbi:MAG: hypothetical protein IKX94_07825, partial [Muribaculaceae bacterium]|nr:hypothetical protein [Muribaculaceae bacterium]